MDNLLYQTLLDEIRKLFPKRSMMVNTLAEILRIEKGAVYRRIRQDVPFTFNEIAVIARHLNISLDGLVGIENERSVLFQFQFIDFITPKEQDFYFMNASNKFLQTVFESNNSERASTFNVLPLDLFYGFSNLLKFYIFVWNYHTFYLKSKHFQQVIIHPEMSKLMDNYMMEMKNFSKTFFVFDNGLFRFFVDRVYYFNSIRLLEKDDVSKIKEDLHSMLDYMEKMAISGQYKETGNAVNIYISDIDITTGYTYYETKTMRISMIKAFIMSYVSTFDENTFVKMKHWINALIKISTLITLTNEKQRVLYFEKQRKIVDEL